MPQKVRDLVCKASRLGKSTLPITESKELSSFVPLYLLCRTFDLYDRTKQLDIDFKTYRNEFELLQIGTKPSHRVNRQGADAVVGTPGQRHFTCDNVKANQKAKTLPCDPQTARSSHPRRPQESSQQYEV